MWRRWIRLACMCVLKVPASFYFSPWYDQYECVLGAIKPGAAGCYSTEVWPSSGRLRGDWEWRVRGETPRSWDSQPASMAPAWLIESSWAWRRVAPSSSCPPSVHLSSICLSHQRACLLISSSFFSLSLFFFFTSDVLTASTFHPFVSFSLSAPPLPLSCLSFVLHIYFSSSSSSTISLTRANTSRTVEVGSRLRHAVN